MTDDDVRALIDDSALRQDVTAVELAEAFLARIEASQTRLRALITVTGDLALAHAREVDGHRARGRRLQLDGMPIVVKDVVDIAGVSSTRGSRLFADRVATDDAAVVERLRRAGAVILGTANLHEVAFGATSRNEAFGHVVNPWDARVIPGGSSGGSGAAVAADLCIGAIGTDTGGSVRIPASCCGVSGIRPTYGSVSTRGVFPVSPTLDTVGPLARNVEDLVLLLAASAGFDPEDARSVVGSFDPALDAVIDVSALRIGVPRAFFFEDLNRDVAGCVERAIRTFVDLGAEVVDLDLPGAADAVAACGQLIWAEALAVHREHVARSPDLLEHGTRRRLALAEGLTAADISRLLEEMYDWQRSIRRAFETVDMLLTPTLPLPPPPVADAESVGTTAQVVPFTFALSLARIPALSTPCGFTADGHPVGLQLAARRWEDGVVLQTAASYQRVTDWHRRRPA